jgi:hypothetical protein
MGDHTAVLAAPHVTTQTETTHTETTHAQTTHAQTTHAQARHEARPSTRLGGLTLALGTIGTLFGVVPFTFMLAVVFGALGLVSGAAGAQATRHGQPTDQRSLRAGRMLSVLAVTLGAVGYLVLVVVTEDLSSTVG